MHDEGGAAQKARLCLPKRYIAGRLRRTTDRTSRIGDYTDNLPPRTSAAVYANSLSQRRNIAKETLRKGFVDDCYGTCALTILIGERAAFAHGHSQNLEVVRTNRFRADRPFHRVFRHWRILDAKVPGYMPIKRHVRRHCNGADAGKGEQLFPNAGIELLQRIRV